MENEVSINENTDNNCLFMPNYIVTCDFVESQRRKSFIECFKKIMEEFNLESQESNILTFSGKSDLKKTDFLKELYHTLIKFEEFLHFQDLIVVYYYKNEDIDSEFETEELKRRGTKNIRYFRLLD